MSVNILDDPASYQRIDPGGMLRLVTEFPSQIDEAYTIGRSFKAEPLKDIHQILVCGMGGSAIGGDLIKAYALAECPVPIQVHRGYGLPRWANDKTLVIASSYSGNTEESLDAYTEAKTRRCKVLAITTGGKLLDFAKARGDMYIVVKPGYSPRAALGFSFFPMLAALSTLGFLTNQDDAVAEARDVVANCCEAYGVDVPADNNPAKKIAATLKGRMAVIYSSVGAFEPVGYRIRCQINENAKALALNHVLPEMNHNEIVGWSGNTDLTKQFHVIYLRDKDDHSQIRKRFDVMKPIIEPNAAGVTEANSGGKGLLARMFSLISFGDFASVYLAVLLGSDPTPVVNIDRLKAELAK